MLRHNGGVMHHDRFLLTGPDEAPLTVVIAHGAGAAMDSPFLATIADGIGEAGFRVVRFEFPYMRRRRRDGRRRAPDATVELLRSWREAVAELGGGRGLVIGGKSLGGRIASMIADEVAARGLICLGYPFHPPGKPERLRTAHLSNLVTPTLIVQGTRDPFGRPEEVASYNLSPAVRMCWIEGGDHSLKSRLRSGRTEAQNLTGAVEAAVGFLRELAVD